MVPFFLSATCLPSPPACVATANNEAIRPLIATRLVSHCGFAPGCLWLTTNWCTAFTTAMWVIAWVHGRTAYRRASTHMSCTTSFTNALILMVNVANLTDGGHTHDMDFALLTGWETKLGVIPFFRHKLCTYTCAPYELTTTAMLHFDVMDGRTRWDVLHRKSIAYANVSLGAGLNAVTHFKPYWR